MEVIFPRKIQSLYNRRKKNVTDDVWLSNMSIRDKFLYIISWGPWRIEREDQVFEQARTKAMGKKLTKVGKLYPLDFQNKFFKRIVKHCNGDLRGFFTSLRKLEPKEAREELYRVADVKTYSKIITCMLRDISKVDCFPIDRRVARLLKKYGFPKDEDAIVKICRSGNIDPRILNRVMYLYEEEL